MEVKGRKNRSENYYEQIMFFGPFIVLTDADVEGPSESKEVSHPKHYSETLSQNNSILPFVVPFPSINLFHPTMKPLLKEMR